MGEISAHQNYFSSLENSGEFTNVHVPGYHTGSNVSVFLNGEKYLGEVSLVAYNVINSKIPIRGYATKFGYDKVASGSVSISGLIALPLTDFRYMNTAVGLATGELVDFPSGLGEDEVSRIIKKKYKDLSNLTPAQAEVVYRQTVRSIIPSQGDRVQSIIAFDRASIGSFNVPTREEASAKHFMENMESTPLHRTSFDIVIVAGNSDDLDAPVNDRENMTTRRILGAHITGEVSRIESSDDPIMISFPFFAKWIDYMHLPIVESSSPVPISPPSPSSRFDDTEEFPSIEGSEDVIGYEEFLDAVDG